MPDNLKIGDFTVEDFKHIKFAHGRPGAYSLFVIGGANGQGKTSLLDALLATLYGKRYGPSRPVREGASKTNVDITLVDTVTNELKYRVKATTNSAGEQTVTVLSPEGAEYPSPGDFLRAFFGEFNLDPLSLMQKKPAELGKWLRARLGIDTSEIDAKCEKLNKDISDRQKLVDKSIEDPGGDLVDINISALTTEYQAAVQTESRLKAAADRKAKLETQIAEAMKIVADLEKELEEPVPDVAAAKSKLDSAQVDQKRIESIRSVRTLKDLRAQKKELDESRKAALRSKPIPVEGITFGEGDELYFNGKPLEDEATSMKFRQCLKLAAMENPRARLWFSYDGGIFDVPQLAIVEEELTAMDAYLILERPGIEGATIEIREGLVVGQDGPVKPEDFLVEGP